jgi:hypothetical protein
LKDLTNTGWVDYFRREFKSPSTFRIYKAAVIAFCQWLAKRTSLSGPYADTVSNATVKAYIVSLHSHGTRLHAIAGLKARYCDFEGLEIKFPKLKKTRGVYQEPKHVAISPAKLKIIFDLAKENIRMSTLVHLLYDAAARI